MKQQVPRGWSDKALRHWMESLDGQRVPLSSEERGSRQGIYPYYGASGVIDNVDGYLFDEPLVLVAEDGANLLLRSTPIAFLATGHYWVNNHAHVLKPRLDSPKYWAYRLASIDFTPLVTGSAQPKLTASALMNMRVTAPESVELQRAIANYLDRETARIDRLIEEQQRLIEMLRQRRAGVILDVVTHGVDGGAAGSTQIGWLGPTPTHWRVGRVKHLGNVTLGKMLQASDSGSDVRAPYMRAANVQPDGVLREDDVKEMWFSVDELASLDLRRGDVVVVEGGIGGYGRAAYLDHDLVGWGFQNSINRIRPHQETDGRYLAYFLIMARSMGFIEAYCNVVSMPHLTAEKLNSMPVPIPPLDEQQRIATCLDDQTSKIDALIAETERFIELARERRSALITAAVTGQIDVSESAA